MNDLTSSADNSSKIHYQWVYPYISITSNKTGDNISFSFQIDIQPVEKPKSVEYHVGQKVPRENPLAKANQRRRSGDSLSSTESGKVILRGQGNLVTVVPVTRQVTEGVIPEAKIPDEEIDSAFEIIDKL